MPTFHDAVEDADEAYEAVRALAHATIRFHHDDDPVGEDGRRREHPEDTYTVLGNVLGMMRSLSQVVKQIGTAHDRHADSARTDDGSAVEGRNHVRTVLHHVHDAVRYLEHAHATLNTAMSASGCIAWHLPESPETAAPYSVEAPVVIPSTVRARSAQPAFGARSSANRAVDTTAGIEHGQTL